MDLGLFRRGKLAVWAWVILPALLTAVVLCALEVVCNYVEQNVAQQGTLARIWPALDRRLTVAADVIAGFAVLPSGEADMMEALGSRLNAAAQRHNFAIDSLRIDKDESAAKDKGRVLIMAVRGEGPLDAVMKFVGEVQAPQSLVAVASAKLKAQQLTPHLLYEGEFVFKCHDVARALAPGRPQDTAPARKTTP